jgi:hypothetical protein
MSGIEIIVGVFAAVSSLVTIFKHGHSLYRDWKASKKSEELSQSLTTGEHQLQHEYNAHFKIIGSQFASGDGRTVGLNVATDTVDIAVSQLKDVIIVMQSELISVLQASIRSESGGVINLFRKIRIRTTDHPRLINISDTARRDSIRALAALAQRLAPVPRSISEPAANTPSTNEPTSGRALGATTRRPAGFFCQGARHLQENRSNSEADISRRIQKRCDHCGGVLYAEGMFNVCWLGNPKINPRFVNKSHLPLQAPRAKVSMVELGCIFCESQQRFESYYYLWQHMKDFHTASEFEKDCDLVVVWADPLY